MNLLSRDRVDDRWLDTEEWKRSTAWLGGSHTGEGGNDIGAGLGLPVRLCFGQLCLLGFSYLSLRRRHELLPFQQFQSTTSILLRRLARRRIPRL